jgi:putative oxygen-independent coproporphyrinogen III oxidase
MTLPPLSLYIHLPWCERKCPYCDFNSHEVDAIPEAQYIDALLRDLAHDTHLTQGRKIESIFIGGGTPSLFSADAIKQLMKSMHEIVEVNTQAEITMEANPGSAEALKFEGFRTAGINRLSLGIQSFDDECLSALGRVHNSAQALAAIDHAKAAGFDNINLDLMHGLPGQSLESAKRDLDMAVAADTNHLSWYQLTIEPNTVFYNRVPTLPDEAELGDIQSMGEVVFLKGGFEQYEVSAYCKNSRRSAHNLNYWRFGDYLGIGAGAHGKITSRDGSIRRYAKRRQPDQYMKSPEGGHSSEHRALPEEDLPGEFILNALRLNEGFGFDLFSTRTGLNPACIASKVESLQERGLLEVVDERIRATETGRRFLDTVITEFLAD